ncbi:MAG: hybrid sensor histidine kinase/response regulator [Parachlamydia sp.]|nr:hybrid sensor histidine kinase/response regulator [Parachlamydia sp.]
MNPILSLFHSDLQAQVRAMQECLTDLKEERADTTTWNTLETAFRAIGGGAKLARLDAAFHLAKAMEEGAASLKEHPEAWTVETGEIFRSAIILFQTLSAAETSLLPDKIAEMKESFETAASAFTTAEKPKKAKAKEKPAVQPKEVVVFDQSLMELFRNEVETQVAVLNKGLVELEGGAGGPEQFEALMRAAHSIKGAARVVLLEPIVQLAHVIEDCFVAAQKQKLVLQPAHIDALLAALDVIGQLSQLPAEELPGWIETKGNEISAAAKRIASMTSGEAPQAVLKQEPQKIPERAQATKTTVVSDRILRVSAQNLNRLMGLAGESMVESRWLSPFSTSLLTVKKRINELDYLTDMLRKAMDPKEQNESVLHYLSEVHRKINELSQGLTDRLTELDLFIIRHSNLSDRLYREVIDSRMCPFSDGIGAFPRLVRDLARELGKKVRLVVIGPATPVDRDILEKLEAPLSHLLRNAVDHGMETPEEREKQGKPPEGTITLEAQHRAGMLAITVSDDGRGVDVEAIRNKIVDKNLVQASVAERLTQQEVLEFLFLPGFSTAVSVTEISGRGVGLNVVQSMIQEVSGSVRIQFDPGKGTSFHLQLPLTLSVIRALLVDISGEPYAFPLARIDRALHIPKDQIEQVESRQYFRFEGQNVGLVPAAQVLELLEHKIDEPTLPIIILSDHMNFYGIVVDQFLGERELVVQELDLRLGKVPDISSGALMEDGSPILIVDVDDMVRSIDTILSGGRLHRLSYGEKAGVLRRKRILVVDDSITVREVECRLLQNRGYDVQTAVNGMDGWNALRMGEFDLVITDVDMPRMNGIELIRLIRSDPRLQRLPVMIVSYKEREEDRRLGLDAGANYYLTKSSFHDESMIAAVADLIGTA